ncbi:hypothetical protein BKA60DRAFT_8547 [Fusarium oxysporum]|nr:hypothetical protein BKA60DRAFT_8547 [Fusarium oxysporum]
MVLLTTLSKKTTIVTVLCSTVINMGKFGFTRHNHRCMRTGALLCLLLFLAYHFHRLWESHSVSHSKMTKPDGVVVSGLVFYGRWDRTSCMYCYLQQNMVDEGGWLDEVLWVVNTDDKDDLEYLEKIVAQEPQRHNLLYIKGNKLSTNTYYKAWEHLERGKYYVKIDDGVVLPNAVLRGPP